MERISGNPIDLFIEAKVRECTWNAYCHQGNGHFIPYVVILIICRFFLVYISVSLLQRSSRFHFVNQLCLKGYYFNWVSDVIISWG